MSSSPERVASKGEVFTAAQVAACLGVTPQAAREALSVDTRERMTRAGADAQQNTEKLVRSLVDAIEGEKGNQASILAELQRWKDWQGTIEKQIEGLRNR